MSFANVLSPFEIQQTYPHQYAYTHSTLPVATMNNSTGMMPATSGSGFPFGGNSMAPPQLQFQPQQFFQPYQPFGQMQQPQMFSQSHPTKRPRGSYEEDLSEEAWAPKRTRVILDNPNNFAMPTPSMAQSTQFGSAPNFPMTSSVEIPSTGAIVLHPTLQKRTKRNSMEEEPSKGEKFANTKRNKLKGFFGEETDEDSSYSMRNIITCDNRLSAWKEDLSKAIILYPTTSGPAVNNNYDKPFLQSRSYITEVDDEEETPSGMDVA
eukprot:TRINITY_DN11735_c0_g1_i1.p1 TRINITY_DN11735_c0_g1~~TRINITY_DN11735_c0_g1_i1.p1  ORF type:complete len:265 (+),score=41.64 TRINITY_DN11735_c0_g1_i1:78-872(+)